MTECGDLLASLGLYLADVAEGQHSDFGNSAAEGASPPFGPREGKARAIWCEQAADTPDGIDRGSPVQLTDCCQPGIGLPARKYFAALAVEDAQPARHWRH